MSNRDTVIDYGWQDAAKTCSHSYLEPAILKLCNKLALKRILDLGCGNGALCKTLFDAGFEVVGCDADEKGIQLGQQENPEISFKHLGVYDDPLLLASSDFDAVVSTEVIEHLLTPRHLPKFAKAVLKENGFLIITTPYHGYLKNLVLSILNKWDSHHSPSWDGGHIKFWSPATLTKLLEEEGFAIKSFQGVGRFPYLWKSMILVAQKR